MNSIQLQEKANQLLEKGLMIFCKDYEYDDLRLSQYETILFFIVLYKKGCWGSLKSIDFKNDMYNFVIEQNRYFKSVYDATHSEWKDFSQEQLKEYINYLDENEVKDIDGFLVFFEYLVQSIKYYVGNDTFQNLFIPLEVTSLLTKVVDFENVKTIFQPEGSAATLLNNISEGQKFVLKNSENPEFYQQGGILNTLRFIVADNDLAEFYHMTAKGLELNEFFDLILADIRKYITTIESRAFDLSFFYSEYLKYSTDNGILVAFLSDSSLQENQEFIKNAIEQNFLDLIIELPTNLVYSKYDKTYLLVFKKNRTVNTVRFMDLSSMFFKENSRNVVDLDKFQTEILEKSNKQYVDAISIDSFRKRDYAIDGKLYLKGYWDFEDIIKEIYAPKIYENTIGRLVTVDTLKRDIIDCKLISSEVSEIKLPKERTSTALLLIR